MDMVKERLIANIVSHRHFSAPLAGWCADFRSAHQRIRVECLHDVRLVFAASDLATVLHRLSFVVASPGAPGQIGVPSGEVSAGHLPSPALSVSVRLCPCGTVSPSPPRPQRSDIFARAEDM